MWANWKTTIFGVGAGALELLSKGVGWKQVLTALAYAGLGAFAKDSNVTGGTKTQ